MKTQHLPEEREHKRYRVVGGIIPFIKGTEQKGFETDTGCFHEIN
jgi:hypothetical protein